MKDLEEMRRIAKDITPEKARAAITVTHESLERMIAQLLGFTIAGVGKARDEAIAVEGTITRLVVPHIKVHGIKVHMADTQISYLEYTDSKGDTQRIDL